MGSQQFCLKWNNHQSNLLNVFDQLLQNEAFVDVTLACEGLSLKAHKMVLSACSPYFQTLFLENPCKHPIVILNSVRYSELKAIVDFMYKGEVNVSQEQLSLLLKTAEMLKVKGLAEVTNQTAQSLNANASDPILSVPSVSPPPSQLLSNHNHRRNGSPPPKRKKVRANPSSSAASSPQSNTLTNYNASKNSTDQAMMALDQSNDSHLPLESKICKEENTDQCMMDLPPKLIMEPAAELVDDQSSMSNITSDMPSYDPTKGDTSVPDLSSPPDITSSNIQSIPSTSGLQGANQELSWSRSDILVPVVEYSTSASIPWLKQDLLANALTAVRNRQLTITDVAQSFGMGRKTIHKQLGVTGFSKLPLKRGPKTLLTEEEEKAVVDYIHSFTGRGTRPRRDEIIRYASSILQQKTGTGIGSSDETVDSMKTKVGIKWWKKFRARHPELRDMRGNIPRERPLANLD